MHVKNATKYAMEVWSQSLNESGHAGGWLSAYSSYIHISGMTCSGKIQDDKSANNWRWVCNTAVYVLIPREVDLIDMPFGHFGKDHLFIWLNVEAFDFMSNRSWEVFQPKHSSETRGFLLKPIHKKNEQAPLKGNREQPSRWTCLIKSGRPEVLARFLPRSPIERIALNKSQGIPAIEREDRDKAVQE